MSQKSKAEIIKETVEFYTNNPRSKSEADTCRYLTDDGKKCAFSRCCTDNGVTMLHESNEGKSVPDMHDTYLKPEYQGYENMFWYMIQRLHDEDTFWGADGLTPKGKGQVEYLLNTYED